MLDRRAMERPERNQQEGLLVAPAKEAAPAPAEERLASLGALPAWVRRVADGRARAAPPAMVELEAARLARVVAPALAAVPVEQASAAARELRI
jgi:hypothetical protein